MGQAIATGFFGLHGNVFGDAQYTTVRKNTAAERVIARALATPGNRKLRSVMKALNGAAAGGTATATHTRIKAESQIDSPMSYGGLVQIETVSDVNTATLAADETHIDQILQPDYSPSYAPDLSGNGGGGKLGW